MRACWLKWVGRDWSISADYIWLNYSDANTAASYSREDEILRFLAEHPSITRKEAQTLLGIGQSTAGRILKEMVDKGQIARHGGGRTLRYELA